MSAQGAPREAGASGAAEAPPPLTVREFAALALAASLTPLASTMMATALPAMGRELSTDTVTLTQWVVTSYLVVSIVAQAPAGRAADAFGHPRTLFAGQAIFATGSAIGLFAPTVSIVVLARVLSAAGGGLIVPSAMAMLRTRVAAGRRDRAFGTFSAAMAAAAAVGPVVGGELTARAGWRALFAAALVPLAVSFVLLRGGGVAAGLTAHAGSARRPTTLPLELVRRGPFRTGAMLLALQNLSMYALLFQMPAFFADVRGVGTDRTAWAQLVMMLATVVMAAIGGRLSERFGPRALVTIGSLAATVGLYGIHDLSRFTRPEQLVGWLALFGAGLGLSTGPSQAAAMSDVDPARSGTAAGHLSTLRYLGGIAGIAALGAIVGGAEADVALARHGRAVEVFSAVLALSVLLALSLPSTPAKLRASRLH